MLNFQINLKNRNTFYIVLKQRETEMGETIRSLTLENQKHKEEPYRIMLLLAGGGIFLLGCIVTLVIQGTGRRSSLSF